MYQYLYSVLAKKNTISTILIGHIITKDGQLAGPKILEHMVDTVLQFEGDQQIYVPYFTFDEEPVRFDFRNRIYEMLQSGLRQGRHPSELLLSNHDQELSGIAVSATVEGVRPIFIGSTVFGVDSRLRSSSALCYGL